MNQTFIAKYKPYYIKDFTNNKYMLDILNTLFNIDDLNILFVGNYSSGKTTLLYALIREYYGFKKDDYISENNILFINNLKLMNSVNKYFVIILINIKIMLILFLYVQIYKKLLKVFNHVCI